jgi:uncharacterized protein
MMTLLVWIGWRFFSQGQGSPSIFCLVMVIALSSIIFGVRHLRSINYGGLMERLKIIAVQNIFSSRLDTLNHLLDIAESHFIDEIESLLQRRIAPDMLPFGTQIVFTCNQPRNFALWCLGQSDDNLNPNVNSLTEARGHISATKDLVASINTADNKLSEIKHIDFGQGLYTELPGFSYVDDFLMPNFYFHLTTAYDILRMAGAPIGKRDFMLHFVPLIKHQS